MNGMKIFELDMNNSVDEAFGLAPAFKMNTADLLYIVICKSLKMKKSMRFDKEMTSKKIFMDATGIEVKYGPADKQ